MEIVDCFDVQALRSADVLEDVPISTRGSTNHISGVMIDSCVSSLRALEESDEEARRVQRNSVE